MLYRTSHIWLLLRRGTHFPSPVDQSVITDTEISQGLSLISVLTGSAIYCVGFVICADVSLTYVLDCYQEVCVSFFATCRLIVPPQI